MRHIVLALAVLLLTSSSIYAMSAHEAKKKGLIAEKCDGYVKALKPEGKEIAANINAQRREEYTNIAKQENIPVGVVEARSGKKLCTR